MERFDYLIMSESNHWHSTGSNLTEQDLQDDIDQLKEEYPDEQLIVFKAPKMEHYDI